MSTFDEIAEAVTNAIDSTTISYDTTMDTTSPAEVIQLWRLAHPEYDTLHISFSLWHNAAAEEGYGMSLGATIRNDEGEVSIELPSMLLVSPLAGIAGRFVTAYIQAVANEEF